MQKRQQKSQTAVWERDLLKATDCQHSRLHKESESKSCQRQTESPAEDFISGTRICLKYHLESNPNGPHHYSTMAEIAPEAGPPKGQASEVENLSS